MTELLLLPLLVFGYMQNTNALQIVTQEVKHLSEPPQVKMQCRIVVANTGRQTLSTMRVQALFFTPGNVLKVEHRTFQGPIYPDEAREWEFVTEFNHYTTDEIELSVNTWAKEDPIGGYV